MILENKKLSKSIRVLFSSSSTTLAQILLGLIPFSSLRRSPPLNKKNLSPFTVTSVEWSANTSGILFENDQLLEIHPFF